MTLGTIEPTDYLKRIDHLAEYTTKILQLTQQSLQALTQQGYKVAGGDVNTLIRESEAELRSVKAGAQQLIQQLDQFQALVRTSALMTSSLELEQVLEGVMDTVIHLTGAERAYLMLKASDGDELIVHAARNWDRETIEKEAVTYSRGIIQSALESGEPILTTNAQSDERFQNRESVMINALRSVIVIPLILKGQAMGVLYADNRLHKTVFNQQSIPLLTAFANQATIAIQNARLFEKVKDDLQEAQREVQRLKVQIDKGHLATQIDEITDSEYFQRISEMAKSRRRPKADGE